MRFYVEYGADCGYGAGMTAHDVIQATNWKDAMATWHQKVSGFPAYKRLPPEACFALPASMRDWERERVLGHYRDVSFDRQYVAPEDEALGGIYRKAAVLFVELRRKWQLWRARNRY